MYENIRKKIWLKQFEEVNKIGKEKGINLKDKRKRKNVVDNGKVEENKKNQENRKNK